MQQNNDEEKFVEQVIDGISYYWHPEYGWLAKSFEEFMKRFPTIGCMTDSIDEPNTQTHWTRVNMRYTLKNKFNLAKYLNAKVAAAPRVPVQLKVS